MGHGALVIAAITSCTNTSNPAVMLGADIHAGRAIADLDFGFVGIPPPGVDVYGHLVTVPSDDLDGPTGPEVDIQAVARGYVEDAFDILGRRRVQVGGGYLTPPGETALWDLIAKQHEQPLYRVLGGTDPRVPAYASTLDFRLDDADFRDFVFGHSARLYTHLDPEFFEGTVIADACRRETAASTPA